MAERNRAGTSGFLLGADRPVWTRTQSWLEQYGAFSPWPGTVSLPTLAGSRLHVATEGWKGRRVMNELPSLETAMTLIVTDHDVAVRYADTTSRWRRRMVDPT